MHAMAGIETFPRGNLTCWLFTSYCSS